MLSKKIKIISGLLIMIIFVLVSFVGCDINDFFNTSKGESEEHNENNNDNSNTFESGNVTFHFLELGNHFTGDCTYIKAGDIDILIDAGSRTSSIPFITNYINNYVADNKLEYVIVTHAHEDHYSGFATNTSTNSIFDLYEIGIIIDFARTNQSDTAKMYTNYQRERSEAVQKGAVHYTAQDCIAETNGAAKEFEICAGFSMTILDQKFYRTTSSKENNYSVCTLFTQDGNNFLFTGDLEAEGEASLVSLNYLPHCKLYKAGHHGSNTSSNITLLSKITPEVCCVCCCAGNVEYTQENAKQFPSQDFVDRISMYTDKVYVTTLGYITYNSEKNKYVNSGFTSMNGNIVVSADNNTITVICSNNDLLLKDTEWFKQNRTCPGSWREY